jgi:signal peptidase I
MSRVADTTLDLAPVLTDRPARTSRLLVATQLLTVVVWAVVAVVVFRPTFLGGQTGYTLVSGDSMYPTFHNGDLIFTRARDSYAPGDVIAFRVGGGHATVIHRIVGGSARRGYVTQGDNRDTVDSWRPKPDDVIGVAHVRVPYGGTVIGRLKGPLGLALLAAGIAAILLWPPQKTRTSGRGALCRAA